MKKIFLFSVHGAHYIGMLDQFTGNEDRSILKSANKVVECLTE